MTLWFCLLLLFSPFCISLASLRLLLTAFCCCCARCGAAQRARASLSRARTHAHMVGLHAAQPRTRCSGFVILYLHAPRTRAVMGGLALRAQRSKAAKRWCALSRARVFTSCFCMFCARARTRILRVYRSLAHRITRGVVFVLGTTRARLKKEKRQHWYCDIQYYSISSHIP